MVIAMAMAMFMIICTARRLVLTASVRADQGNYRDALEATLK